MIQQRAYGSPSRARCRLLGLAAALIVAAAAAPASASAKPHYEPDCTRGSVCFFENVNWNHSHGHGARDRGQDLRVFMQDRPHDNIALDWNGPAGERLVNRVSSYANFSSWTLCVYDGNARGRHDLLWKMLPGASSSWVGRKMVKGRTVNDRANYFGPC